ncbi:ArsR family transcriptional regulator [Halobacillus rhizosphaerae]|uniref:ArsR/SmtB family transcription factor n=1 Tax=Halobacillus rhizosphaerae TaxID=3064889 RepID=UPI00398BB589
MKQNILYLTNLGQLKSLSDPLRVDILHHLIEKPYSGQQLSQKLDVARSKIHYHLKDLEKNELIYLAGESKKRNMTEKTYRAAAKSFIPSSDIFPVENRYLADSGRLMTLTAIDRTRQRAIEAPEEVFLTESENPENWNQINAQLEVQTTDDKYKKWVKKYHELLKEFNELKDDGEDSKWFYVSTFGFELAQPLFTKNESHSEGTEG